VKAEIKIQCQEVGRAAEKGAGCRGENHRGEPPGTYGDKKAPLGGHFEQSSDLSKLGAVWMSKAPASRKRASPPPVQRP
jgi:hypothetical protein